MHTVSCVIGWERVRCLRNRGRHGQRESNDCSSFIQAQAASQLGSLQHRSVETSMERGRVPPRPLGPATQSDRVPLSRGKRFVQRLSASMLPRRWFATATRNTPPPGTSSFILNCLLIRPPSSSHASPPTNPKGPRTKIQDPESHIQRLAHVKGSEVKERDKASERKLTGADWRAGPDPPIALHQSRLLQFLTPIWAQLACHYIVRM